MVYAAWESQGPVSQLPLLSLQCEHGKKHGGPALNSLHGGPWPRHALWTTHTHKALQALGVAGGHRCNKTEANKHGHAPAVLPGSA